MAKIVEFPTEEEFYCEDCDTLVPVNDTGFKFTGPEVEDNGDDTAQFCCKDCATEYASNFDITVEE